MHDGREALDAARDDDLRRFYGVRVLRIRAWVVERELDSALAVIREALT